mmetsp:Transcript_95306/g.242170  ORF Transcript_95306/g.242170 Transcript_95306/m.242170 type:complete len:407 (+) Transcript_95306:596-1816(+)
MKRRVRVTTAAPKFPSCAVRQFKMDSAALLRATGAESPDSRESALRSNSIARTKQPDCSLWALAASRVQAAVHSGLVVSSRPRSSKSSSGDLPPAVARDEAAPPALSVTPSAVLGAHSAEACREPEVLVSMAAPAAPSRAERGVVPPRVVAPLPPLPPPPSRPRAPGAAGLAEAPRGICRPAPCCCSLSLRFCRRSSSHASSSRRSSLRSGSGASPREAARADACGRDSELARWRPTSPLGRRIDLDGATAGPGSAMPSMRSGTALRPRRPMQPPEPPPMSPPMSPELPPPPICSSIAIRSRRLMWVRASSDGCCAADGPMRSALCWRVFRGGRPATLSAPTSYKEATALGSSPPTPPPPPRSRRAILSRRLMPATASSEKEAQGSGRGAAGCRAGRAGRGGRASA